MVGAGGGGLGESKQIISFDHALRFLEITDATCSSCPGDFEAGMACTSKVSSFFTTFNVLILARANFRMLTFGTLILWHLYTI